MENLTVDYLRDHGLRPSNDELWSHAFPTDDHGERSVRTCTYMPGTQRRRAPSVEGRALARQRGCMAQSDCMWSPALPEAYISACTSVWPDLLLQCAATGLAVYNNFEIVRLEWFLQPSVQDFTAAVCASGGIYDYRWGDAPLRYLTLALFSEPKQVLNRMRDYKFVYCHGGCTIRRLRGARRGAGRRDRPQYAQS